ncbi:MAG: ATP-binding cassette domain-containing protein, partial [Burkholderiaceae bacterium]
GYFAQHQVEMLRHDESPLWHLVKIAPDAREQELRNFLGSFNFPGDMVTSPIAPFSGGEKARLALALIVWQRPNLLLLDEPTNHLDLETREALTMALAQFEGTLVLVSHDRHLLRATTDQFMIVADGKQQAFDGDLDDYREWLFKTKLAGKSGSADVAVPSKADTRNAAAEVQATGNVNRRDQKRSEAQDRQRLSTLRKPVETRIKRLEEQLAKHNARKEELDARLAAPEIYDAANKEELKSLLTEQAYCAKEIEQLEMEWLEQQEELEKIS